MITSIRHVGLVVADLERSLNFWCESMGFVVLRQIEESGPHIDAMMGMKNVRVTTVKLAAPDGNLLELLRFHSHSDKPQWEGKPYSTGFTHIALTVQDLDETCSRLQRVGVRFPAEPQISPDGLVRVIYATGPEGVLLELVEILT
jgi:catechol 2,3-dioxygenase-like lactoylglutathione lyase family enzyme